MAGLGQEWQWWKTAVFYEIYPKSFSDGNGDGIGDLDGITDRLGYLADLGVDAIWLAPFYPSPMADGGYDVSDFCDVASDMGTLKAFDGMLSRAHSLGIRVITDLVANHTSDQHPWFQDSRSSRAARRRDWYIWRDKPNGWRAALTDESAWTYDKRSGQYYLHLFLAQQPDLNWRNEEVAFAMHSVMRFWLERGVDGFRVDAAQCLAKDPEFRDTPELLTVPVAAVNDQPYTHEIISGLKKVVQEYGDDRLLLGEIYVDDAAAVSRYCSPRYREFDLAFNFSLLRSSWSSEEYASVIREVQDIFEAAGAWPTWVLSNHDRPRVRTRFSGSPDRARAAFTVLSTLRGSPFIYQGEELGLVDAVVPSELAVDPKGRDGQRAPIPWAGHWPHEWNGILPRLPFPPESVSLNVESQSMNSESMLSFCRRMLRLRRASEALQIGCLELLEGPDEIVMYSRKSGLSELITVVNFSDRIIDMTMPGEWQIIVSSSGGGEQSRYQGVVPPETAFVLELSPRAKA